MSGKFIEGIDLVDIVRFVDYKSKVFQRKMLDSVEEILQNDPEKYLEVRKIILDGINDLRRSILTIIFGTNFEGTIK